MDDFREFDALDEALDRLAEGSDELEPGLARLLEPARRLRAVLPVVVPPALEAEHLERLRRGPEERRTPLRRRAGIVALAATIALSLMASSAVALSDGAKPGETLFGLKRAWERVGLAMQRAESGRAEFALMLVERRLEELRAVAGDPRKAEAARKAYEHAIDDAEKRLLPEHAAALDALLGRAEENLRRHVATLNELLDKLPPHAAERIQRAIDRASQAEEKVADGRAKRKGDPGGRGKGRSSSRGRK